MQQCVISPCNEAFQGGKSNSLYWYFLEREGAEQDTHVATNEQTCSNKGDGPFARWPQLTQRCNVAPTAGGSRDAANKILRLCFPQNVIYATSGERVVGAGLHGRNGGEGQLSPSGNQHMRPAGS